MKESQILVFLETRDGQICSFAVVLVAFIDGVETCITRYDTAHGQAHRDVLGKRSGLIEKDWLLNLTTKEAFEYALVDLKENHERYIESYVSH